MGTPQLRGAFSGKVRRMEVNHSPATADRPAARWLVTVEIASGIFADAGKTPAAIRADIFKAGDRFNSRGDRIAGNGLAEHGAVIRRGRKVLIDVNRYGN